MTDSPPSHNHSADVVIIGGGIAGLWLLNRLCGEGYNAILLERDALGSDQTMASQGMIHGGIKYSLGGALTGASEAVAAMPDHWRDCLRGEGDVNLSQARVLSDHFYLWSSGGIGSRMGAFFASKATRGRVDRVKGGEMPSVFHDPAFRGSLYRLVDKVVDAPSVVAALADNHRQRLFRIDWDNARWQQGHKGLAELVIGADDGEHRLQATTFVFTAGAGNEGLLAGVGARAPAMQRRPLHQVMVRHRLPHRFYGHCLGTETRPRLTVSSHPLSDGSQVWYLGGGLAERGVALSEAEMITAARGELAALFPWLDFADARWATLRIDRAEPRQQGMTRPDSAFAQWALGVDNVVAAWPTKLTLAPDLAKAVIQLLREKSLSPTAGECPTLPLPRPAVAATPWALAFGVDDGAP